MMLTSTLERLTHRVVVITRGQRGQPRAPHIMGSTHMMVLDYSGDGEPMENAQLGRHHHRACRMDATETETREALLFQRAAS